MSPAKVEKVLVEEEDKSATVIVPDYQLSLAIGKEGQNVRLAAKLCGWKIDIKSHTQYFDSQEADTYPEEDELEQAEAAEFYDEEAAELEGAEFVQEEEPEAEEFAVDEEYLSQEAEPEPAEEASDAPEEPEDAEAPEDREDPEKQPAEYSEDLAEEIFEIEE